MYELLARIIDAHGGIERWNRYERVEATIVSGGGLFRLKGIPQDSTPRRMTVWLHERRSSVFPYGAPEMPVATAPTMHTQPKRKIDLRAPSRSTMNPPISTMNTFGML